MSKQDKINFFRENISNLISVEDTTTRKFRDVVGLSNNIYLYGALITEKTSEDDINSELNKYPELKIIYFEYLRKIITNFPVKNLGHD